MGDSNQDYFLPDSWDGTEIYLLNNSTNTAVDLDCAFSKNGTAVHSWFHDRSNTNQIWRLRKVDPNSAWSSWTLTCRGNGAVLDLHWGLVDDGTKIQGWERIHSNRNQEWYIIAYRGSDDVFLLQNMESATYLDLECGRGGNGVKIHGWKRNNSEAQKWRFVRV